ncbi:dihydrodipicolinate synthase family protein [Leptothrix sp. BB-4]
MTTPTVDRLPGIWPAMLTPLKPDGSIDHDRFVRHGRALLDAGCGGLTPFGTTGEGPSFSVAERIAAVDALVAGGIPAARLLVSTSACALTDLVALTTHATRIGAWGTMLMPPFFFKGMSDAGVVSVYEQVIAQARAVHAGLDATSDTAQPLRLMLYHIPQVAGIGLTHGVIRTLLARHADIIVGVKDSQCQLAHSLSLLEAFGPQLMVHVGNEPDLPELGRRGSTGAVSGLANFIPRTVHRLVRQPDAATTPDDLAFVQALLGALGGYALVPAFKGILALRDNDLGWLPVRAPLQALTPEDLPRLQAALAAVGHPQRPD